MPTCLLVRHGRTTANAAGTLAGWTPGVDLDDTGRAQVSDLAERVAELPVRAVVTSPLLRCRTTATILTDRLGRGGANTAAPTIEEDVELGECRYGAWTGRALSELATEPLWRVVQNHPSAAVFPTGEEYPAESMAQMSARAVAAIRAVDARLAQEHGPDALWIAVSHGDVIKAILTDAMGAHLDQIQRVNVGPASLSIVRYTPERPFVVKVNDTGASLAGLLPAAPPRGADSADSAASSGPASSDAAVGGGL